MEPIDGRITAAQLMAVRSDPNATQQISALLGVNRMPRLLARRTRSDIVAFVLSGDAILASQLIHAALVRRRSCSAKPGAGRRVPRRSSTSAL